MPIAENEKKLAELILYISQKLADDPNFGQVKLNKVLFFADFTSFGKYGITITGAEYQHLDQGPTVYQMLPVQRELKSEEALAIQPTSYWGYSQNRTVNLREPDLSLFSGQEIALVDLWVDRLRPMTAVEVSRLSHETASWATTSDREIIDPKTVFLSWAPLTAAELRRGQELAAEHGLLA